jgi:putative two-component system response regulator
MNRSGVVLVVDDTPANVRLLGRLLSADGYTVIEARDGHEAVHVALSALPDVVLMDIRMPRQDGFAACRALKAHPSTLLTPVILMTGAHEGADRLLAIEAGADDYVSKPIDRTELRARLRSLMRAKHYTDDLDSAEAVILSLGQTVEARSPYTHGHCRRLASYGEALGRALALSADELAALRRGGYLHDIGKIAIPDAILFKQGPLTPAETREMRRHTIVGDELCGALRALRLVRPIVRHHHERLDGGGYPDGLVGGAVPILAQIISLVDAYDAMTTDRPYRSACAPSAALESLYDDAARGWRDRGLVDAFAAIAPSFQSEAVTISVEPTEAVT